MGRSIAGPILLVNGYSGRFPLSEFSLTDGVTYLYTCEEISLLHFFVSRL